MSTAQQLLDLLELQAHLVANKASALAWTAEDPDNRWTCYATTDLEHWTAQGISTVAQFEHHMAAADHYDTYKEVNGIRCRWMDYSVMTTEEIVAETEQMITDAQEQWAGEAEWIAHIDMIDEENHRYNDMFHVELEPNKYELMAQRAGYAA